MDQPAIIGVDLAKTVFQVLGGRAHGPVGRRGRVLAVLSRRDPCLTGMEAGSGVHHRARRRAAPGREVRPMVNRDRGRNAAATARGTGCGTPQGERGKTGRAAAQAHLAER